MAEHAMARRALLSARDAVVKSEGRLARFKLQTGKMVERLVQTAEVQTGALAMGIVNGRYTERTAAGVVEPPAIVGIPVELFTGVLLHLIGYSGFAGKVDEHLHNLGDGAVAAWTTQAGRGLGQEWRTSALAPAGALPAARVAGYSDADIAAMAARGHR